MAVDVDSKTFEASGPSKRTAKLHVAVKVSVPLLVVAEQQLKLAHPQNELFIAFMPQQFANTKVVSFSLSKNSSNL